MTSTKVAFARAAAPAALALALVVALVAVATSGSSYVVHAQFTDASQLVRGDIVQVGGRKVGTVGDLRLTPNGLADVSLTITDGSLVPLHRDTFATVSLVSLSGIANRFVSLTPGSLSAPEIPNGGVLPPTHTKGAVDLDVLLDTLDPATRKSLQTLIARGAEVVSRPAGKQFNQALAYLNPALSQTRALGSELLLDREGLRRLLKTTATVSAALAQRRADISGAITNTAATLRTVAGQSAALSDLLARAPAVFTQARAVLADTDFALGILDPTLRDLQPVAAPVASLIRAALPVVLDAEPTIREVQALLPSARKSLKSVIAAERVATPALKSIAAGVGPLEPIVAGIRTYMPDFVAGFFQGVTGNSGGAYDANGHYIRVGFAAGNGGGITGLLPPAPVGVNLQPRAGLVARCPGGATDPAQDHSNPWLPPGFSSLCNPQQDMQ